MIKEKYFKIITIILILSSFILISFIYYINKTNPTLVEPDYVDKVFDKNNIIQIDIEISEENWNSLLENALLEEYVSADITINGTTIENVGIRAKGNSTLTRIYSSDSDRYSFKIKFSEYISDQNLYGLEKMVLNNMMEDPSYMKEYMSYEIMDFLEVNTPAYAFANITINGEDWGFYLALEVLEEDFLERYYGKNYGTLYKPESDNAVEEAGDRAGGQRPIEDFAENIEDRAGKGEEVAFEEDLENAPTRDAGNVRGGRNSEGSLRYIDDDFSSYTTIFDSVITNGLTDNDKQEYVNMVKALETGEEIEKYVDVDEVLRYFAVNTFIVNLDSYAGSMKHNYYLYEQDGVFQILPWDFNLSFGTFQMTSASSVINFPIDAPVTDSMENSPLIAKLLEIDEYKEIYHQYLSHIVENYINNGTYSETINRLNDLIYDYVANDKTAFFTIEEYELAVENMHIYGEDRAKSVTLQLSGQQPSEEYGNLETTLNLNALMGSSSVGVGGKGIENAGLDNSNFEFGELPNEGLSNREFNKNIVPTNTENNSSYNLKENLLYIVPYIILLIIGLLFAKFYKRKKFRV